MNRCGRNGRARVGQDVLLVIARTEVFHLCGHSEDSMPMFGHCSKLILQQRANQSKFENGKQNQNREHEK